MAGDSQIVVAGGVESMSMAPYLLPKARWGHRMGHVQAIDSMLSEGLTCALADCHMGMTAENVAARYGIERAAQDEFSFNSQNKAAQAIHSGAFKDEIVGIEVKKGKETVMFDTDEHPRPGTPIEKLGQLRPAFKTDGTVTAANASGINDGAASLVVMAANKARELGVRPLARIRSWAVTGVDPTMMGIGPVSAVQKALGKAGLTIDEIDLIEANSAGTGSASTSTGEPSHLDTQLEPVAHVCWSHCCTP
jgi:acetyl-CoA C-acetyltransferase